MIVAVLGKLLLYAVYFFSKKRKKEVKSETAITFQTSIFSPQAEKLTFTRIDYTTKSINLQKTNVALENLTERRDKKAGQRMIGISCVQAFNCRFSLKPPPPCGALTLPTKNL